MAQQVDLDHSPNSTRGSAVQPVRVKDICARWQEQGKDAEAMFTRPRGLSEIVERGPRQSPGPARWWRG